MPTREEIAETLMRQRLDTLGAALYARSAAHRLCRCQGLSAMALPLALTMGEPAGIGGEIALKAWLGARRHPALLPDRRSRSARLARPAPRLAGAGSAIDAPGRGAAVFAEALPVMPVGRPVRARPGRPDPGDAPAILGAIETAVGDVRSGRAAALVTNPIHKDSLYRAGFRHPGHTEYLAELAGTGDAPVMMLACPALRVVPVTIHLALRRAVESLSSAAIVHAGRITDAALRRDFGIAAPVLAVAGLNPHAGEAGRLGREEIEIIEPAIAELRARRDRRARPACRRHDVPCRGARELRRGAVHVPRPGADPDQDDRFHGGVNVTLGCRSCAPRPITARRFAIAGRGTARPDSLIAALRLAAEMAAQALGRRLSSRSDRDLAAAAARGHRPARHRRAQGPRAEFPARPQSDRPDRPRRRAARPCDGRRDRPRSGRLDARAARRRCAPRRRDRARPALPRRARRACRRSIPAGSSWSPATRWRSTRSSCRMRRARSSPTCPTTSLPPLLLGWLDRIGEYESLTLMFQREVAERLTAAPRSKSYGRLSVLVQWLAEPQILFDIPPRAFVPPPKVTSSVVRIVPRAEPLAPATQAGARTRHRRRVRPAPQDAALQPADARRPGRAAARAPASRRPPAPRNSRSPNSARSPAPSTAPGRHSVLPVSPSRGEQDSKRLNQKGDSPI